MQHKNSNVYRPVFTLDLPQLSDHDASSAARLDPLTSALTRPAFLDELDRTAAVPAMSAQPAVLLLVDVDQLRNINDEHGHRSGDAVLTEVARRLRQLLTGDPQNRLTHLLGRFDGGALIVCLQQADLDQGFAIAERLRSSVAAATINGLKATISVGVAQHRPGAAPDTTLARIERALQLAKQFGRDRVEVAPVPPVRAEPAAVTPLPAKTAPLRAGKSGT